MFVRVGRQARFRVRRACRARQGAADASRRTRRSLKTARDADAADRRRRFDMPSRISWSRASAYITLTLHKLPVAPAAGGSGAEVKGVKGLGQRGQGFGSKP